jgi:drug/metabolite transporter (DMT)-like permease
LLSLRGSGFGTGELLTLLAAVVWALHLVLLARWAQPEHAVALARVQTATVAGMAMMTVVIGAIFTGRRPLPVLPADGAGWLGVLFLAVLATAATMVLLSWAQSRMSATRAAIILALEPAVAGVTAACLGNELGPRTVIGGGLLVTAMVVVELHWRPRRLPTAV